MHDQDELSDYFRRYPLENPASYVGTRYDPAAAAAWHAERTAWRAATRRAGEALPSGVAASAWEAALRLDRVGRLPSAAGRQDGLHVPPFA